jgi:hypothetical protein
MDMPIYGYAYYSHSGRRVIDRARRLTGIEEETALVRAGRPERREARRIVRPLTAIDRSNCSNSRLCLAYSVPSRSAR